MFDPNHIESCSVLSPLRELSLGDYGFEEFDRVAGPHPTDRRGIIVVLSKAAMRKLPAIFASLAKAMEALVSSYTEKELKILADFFSKAGVLWKEERQKLRRRDAGRDRSRNTGPIPPTGCASLFPAERTRIRC